MTDNKVSDIPILLFQRLAAADGAFKPSNYMHSFAALVSDLERVKFVYGDMKKFNAFPQTARDSKNDNTAAYHRERGNRHFCKGKYKRALEEYTRSVATAESQSAVALAYANRSACLSRLNMYSDCIIDIKRALANDYPPELKQKLIARREEAEMLQKSVSHHEEVPRISQQNPKIQCAGDSVSIAVSKEFGRHVVATRDINIGEEISVEKAFACVVTSDQLIHCHACAELCYNLIPCENCTQALFCSEDCKAKARDAYHKYECPLLLSVIKFGMLNSSLIALRVALLAREDYNNLEKFRFDIDDYRSDRYNEIHGLCTPRGRLSNHDSFYRAVMVSVLHNLLQTETSFFKDGATEDGFKEVMMHQLQLTLSNGVNIFEYAQDNNRYDRTHFGGGVYAFFSLFNHSCCPNVEGSFYGSTVVLRAINTIKKGQQCFINYDTHYGTITKAVRQAMLKENFFFDCRCRACEEDWEPELVDFRVGDMEIFDVEKRLIAADVDFAKQILPRLIAELERCEQDEPEGKALTLKKMIGCCLITLGNRRKV